MGVVASGVRLEVDPEVLLSAGRRIGSIGTQLGLLSDALGEALGSGIASGWDPAGANFGFTYGHQAQQFADALADGANSYKSVGYMLEATGYNYENADAASTIGGSTPRGAVGAEPSTTTAADAPAGSSSAIVPPPSKWTLIQPLLNLIPGFGTFAGAAMTWPTGNPSLLRVTAAQWKNIATGLAAFDGDMMELKALLSQQQIPEGGKIQEALDTLDTKLSSMNEFASTFTTTIGDFATGVQDTQDAIRRLLDRISLDGLWDTVTGFLTGDGDDILREVANDVGDVLENFQNQVKGVVGLLGELTALIGDAATAFQKWIRPILVARFGDDVGNALADSVTLYTDFQVGVVTGLINTVSGVVSLADADTWKGMADVAMSVAEDPSTLPGVLADMGKQFIAYDQWSGDHPGRAAGEAAFNIGSLFVPGGALTKTGNLAKGLRYGSKLFEEGRLPRLSDLPGVGGGGPTPPELDDVPRAGAGPSPISEFHPGSVPDSIVSPTFTNGVDAPTNSSEQTLGGAAGPPGGGGGHGSGGGDGPPPDSPGRPVGPPDSTPGRTDSPWSTSPHASTSSDAPTNSEPSAPSHTTSSADQASPAPHQSSESPSSTADHGSVQQPSEPHTSAANHAPDGPEATGNGHATRQGGGDTTPGEGHHGTSEQRSASPSEQTHTPATPHPDGVARPTPDGSHPREHTATVGDDAHGREPAATSPPSGMAGGGMPMVPPHTMGGGHGPSDAGRAHTPEPPPRTPEPKAPQSTSTDSSRGLSATAGPSTGSAPTTPANATAASGSTAPVSPAATQHSSTAAPEARRLGTDPPTPRPGDGTPSTQPPTHDSSTNDRPGTRPDSSLPSQDGRSTDQPAKAIVPVGNPADTRTYGPYELDHVEDPAYQTAVEDALKDSRGEYLSHADPRTNDYGNLINDGGHTVPGRSNNCLDCSLSALSSFRGEPVVSAPRHPDLLPNGVVDDRSGEHGGLQRASDWLGEPVLPVSPALPIADRFAELHQRVSDMGPGSSALVVNEWHARHPVTAVPLHHPDGRPVIAGSHATVVIYPQHASGPVWWDPQMSTTSDHPPALMVERSASLWATTITPSEGVHGDGTGNAGTSTGVSSDDPTRGAVHHPAVRERMDLYGEHPRGGDPGARFGDGEPDHRQTDWSRDGSVQPADGFGSTAVLGGETDGPRASGQANLSVSVDHQASADPGGRPDDRVSTHGRVTDQSTGADSGVSAHDREAQLHPRSEELVIPGGDVAREMGERPEPGSVAGGGHDPGVADGVGHDTGHGVGGDHYVQLEDGSQHRVWASHEQLQLQESRFEAADAWLAERGLTRSDVQRLLVQPADWLNGAQRELIYGFRHQFPDVASGEPLQKIVDTGQAEGRLAGGTTRFPPNETGGSVSVARDTHVLNTPEQIYDGLALEYQNTPFSSDEAIVAMRFTVDDGVPVHLPDGQLSELAGHGPGYDPGYGYPFTGTGFTASDHHTVPEYFLPAGTRMNPGAEMHRIDVDGSETLIAVLVDRKWIDVVPHA